ISIALEQYGTTAALIMVFGMLVNIIIARITNLKYIFLTGHHTFYMAAFLAILLSVVHVTGTLTVMIGAIILGLIMAILLALAQSTLKKITEIAQVALGPFAHTSN